MNNTPLTDEKRPKPPTTEQAAALADIQEWWKNTNRQTYPFGGLAGTGKTTVIASVAEWLGLSDTEVGYAAYTGKATTVLAGTLRSAGVNGATATLHSLLYYPGELHCLKCPASLDRSRVCHASSQRKCMCGMVFEPGRALPYWRLLIVDESSMIHKQLYRDLLATGIRVLFVGDHGQLGPVEVGPQDRGFNVLSRPDFALENPHRTVADSQIFKVAMRARAGRPIEAGAYGDEVFVINRDAALESSYWHDWQPGHSGLLLCHTNELRIRLNREYRQSLGRNSARPQPGDRLVCLRSNRSKAIFNGMQGELLAIRKDAGSREYAVEIWLPGENRVYRGQIAADQFNRAETLRGMAGVDLWDFAYALTVHKAQGSQADDVILFDADKHSKLRRNRDEYRRWLYTGITRAARTLTIVRG